MMTLPARPALALLAVVVLSLGTLPTWGFYSPEAVAMTALALLLGVLACVAREPAASGRDWGRASWLALCAAALALQFVAIFRTTLLYVGPEFSDHSVAANSALRWFAALGMVPAVYLLLGGRRFVGAISTRWWLALTAILLTGLALRICVLIASPDPIVDVFWLLRDSGDDIIAGQNPYTTPINSGYGTRFALTHDVAEPYDPRPAGYPPVPLLLSVPPRALGCDVRWSNIIADLVAAVAMAILGLRRGRPAEGLLAATVYLNLPRVPFIIEQAWYEPMIAALFGLGFVLTELSGAGQWLGYIMLGLGLTAKQFGLPLLLPLAAGHRRNWKLLALGLAVGGLLILPWFVWSPRAFFDVVLWKQLARPMQPHSITVGSFLLNEFEVTLPRAGGWVLAGAAILGISLVTPRGAAAALGLGTALLAFCVCHTQGFPNYFYLVQYLWLLGFVAALPRFEPEVRTDEPARAPA
jgi:hypothetical protein